jgi:transposase
MKTYLVGIDLAKNVFQLQAIGKQGNVLLKRKVSRKELIKSVGKLQPTIVAMEACGGAHYWGRRFLELGFKVRLIAPQFVRPFVQSNKNDPADADAICIAALRPNTRFVSIKGIKHHDIQSMHRIRSQYVSRRVGLSNMMRGLLSEYGVIAPKGVAKFREKIKSLLSDETLEEDLSLTMKEELQVLWSDFEALEEKIRRYTSKLEVIAKQDETCRRLTTLVGVGPMIATAMLAALVNADDFTKGRQVSAWLGLVPRHTSTGGKTILLGIGKRGDRYCRTLLIHGARASLLSAHRRTDPLSQWAVKLKERKGLNKAAVAVANKNSRLIWAMMKKGNSFKMAA